MNKKEILLFNAVSIGDLKATERLLEYGANPKEMDKSGKTPIFYACEKGYLDCVKALIEYDALVNIKDNDGVTPLFIAQKTKNLELERLLEGRAAFEREKILYVAVLLPLLVPYYAVNFIVDTVEWTVDKIGIRLGIIKEKNFDKDNSFDYLLNEKKCPKEKSIIKPNHQVSTKLGIKMRQRNEADKLKDKRINVSKQAGNKDSLEVNRNLI